MINAVTKEVIILWPTMEEFMKSKIAPSVIKQAFQEKLKALLPTIRLIPESKQLRPLQMKSHLMRESSPTQRIKLR